MFKEFASLKPYLKRHIPAYIVGVLCLFVTNGGQMVIPQLMKRAVNLISDGNTDSELIMKLMGFLVALAFVVAVGRMGWRHFIFGAARHIVRDLRDALYSHLLRLSRKFYGGMKTGDIMARATNDMDHIRMATGMALVSFLDGLLMTVFILVILFRSYPKLTPILIAPLPLLTVLILVVGPKMGKLFGAVQKAYSGISNFVQENISGIRLIKTYRREDYALSQFKKHNDAYIQANLGLVRIWGMFHPIIGFLSGITTFLLLRFGGLRVLNETLDPGDFVAILTYMGMLIWPMMGMGFTISILQRGGVSLGRINAILNEKPEREDSDDALDTPPSGDIRFRDLSFQYPGSDIPVLKDINLTVPAGSTLGILGRTGSGKTTLIDLIPRLEDPTTGSIEIGGRDIRDYRQDRLHESMALVPQESFLFSMTLKENILFGRPEAEEAELNRAIEASTIDRDIKNFPDGSETMVGEKGVSLSGGQKQRTALSRALLMDREILILDDALSAVDTNTEEKILASLRDYCRDKTTLLISHRYSTLKEADQIIVLEEGRISQQGTHKELIEQDGFYKEIYELQCLEEES